MFSNRFVLCILHDGQPQSELANGVVKLPFGTNYGIRCRNKNDRRAVVQLFIDGEQVSGAGYVVPANGHIDIYRHFNKDAGFTFTTLDSPEAVDAGKNGPNEDKSKGVVEAKFFLEKEVPPVQVKYIHETHYWHGQPHFPGYYCSRDYSCDYKHYLKGAIGTSHSDVNSSVVGFSEDTPRGTASENLAAPLQDGCTVEGQSTGQTFSYTTCDTEPTYTSLKVFLQGFHNEAAKDAAVAVSGRFCDRCGALAARVTSKCCHACGARFAGHSG